MVFQTEGLCHLEITVLPFLEAFSAWLTKSSESTAYEQYNLINLVPRYLHVYTNQIKLLQAGIKRWL